MRFSIITPSNNPRYLNELCESVLQQTYADWELLIILNGHANYEPPKDGRIKVITDDRMFTGIGNLKHEAFKQGQGEILVELDHDDLLTPPALEELAKAFDDPAVDFAYSNFAEFKDNTWEPVIYNLAMGWQYRDFEYQGHKLKECVAWEPSPASLSLIFYAPNHVRAWRRTAYEKLGGHNDGLPVCDDHELVIRTYLAGCKMQRIDQCLYLYRVHADQTYQQKVKLIEQLTHKLYADNIEALVLEWVKRAGLAAFDVGAAHNPRPGFKSVDQYAPADVIADLNGAWPWPDNSVGVFRAFDFLEHLADKQHTMAEIHRCLAPGGWLLSLTPSTDGRGAWQDPTHVAFWNQNAFWYWTRKDIAKYIRNTTIRFQQMRLVTEYPTYWHRDNLISYVTADLMKPGAERLPGLLEI